MCGKTTDILLTVFTPTYNRKELLGRAFKSLCAQSCHDFKWLIVDDGSTDGTREAFEDIEAPFEITYVYRENGGKMRAHNTGSALCDTELFLCLDSDDILAPDAVRLITERWKEHRGTHFCTKDSAQRAGIVAYKGMSAKDLWELTDSYDETQVRRFRDAAFMPEDTGRGYSTLRGLYLNGFFGETTLVFRTELLKKFPFPEIPGEKYVPEDYVYDKIDGMCPLLVMDEILTVCELVSGGYTDQAARLRRDNPQGWLLYYEQRMRLENPLMLKIKYLSHYRRFCDITGKKSELAGVERVVSALGAALLRIFGKT